MPRISVALEDETYRALRRVAELNRTRGRASISGVIVRLVGDALKPSPHGAEGDRRVVRNHSEAAPDALAKTEHAPAAAA